MPIENVINALEHLNQKLNVHSVLLLISSRRLIVELLSLKPNVHIVLLLVSSGRLIVELRSLKPNIHSVLLLIVELQNLVHRLSSNRERIATYRANASLKERQQRRENDCINVARRRNAARQSIYDRQRAAVDDFRQSIITGPINPSLLLYSLVLQQWRVYY